MSSFLQSATLPAKCVTATSISHCSSERAIKSSRKRPTILNISQEHPDAPDRRERLRALVECPQLLAGLFCGRLRIGRQRLRSTMLEVLTWRYYRNCSLLDPHSSEYGRTSLFLRPIRFTKAIDRDCRGIRGVCPTCGSGAGTDPDDRGSAGATTTSSSIFMLAIPANLGGSR